MDNEIFMNTRHKGIIMGHLNVRSMWNKMDLLRTTFADSPFSVIVLSETWLTNSYK